MRLAVDMALMESNQTWNCTDKLTKDLGRVVQHVDWLNITRSLSSSFSPWTLTVFGVAIMVSCIIRVGGGYEGSR